MSRRLRELARSVASAERRQALGLRTVRVPRDGNLIRLQREIAAEVAHSLGLAAQRLEAILAELANLEHELDWRDSRTRRPRLQTRLVAADGRKSKRCGDERLKLLSNEVLLERFNGARREAEQRLLYLEIQREALGFSNHDELRRRYRIPQPRGGQSTDPRRGRSTEPRG